MTSKLAEGALLFGSLLILPCLPSAAAQEAPPKVKQAPLKVVVISAWKKWLNEDVIYIISDQERADYKKLTTDQQRDEFITAFWERRNPTPGAPENKFKEEHYRRIAYTTMHFAAAIPGWKTDRGRIYIVYGPPDSIVRHPRAVCAEGSQPPNGDETSRYDWEAWHYQYIAGIGKDVTVEFVDTCGCGEYHLNAMHPVRNPPPNKE